MFAAEAATLDGRREMSSFPESHLVQGSCQARFGARIGFLLTLTEGRRIQGIHANSW
jgi:hypothetical protein